MKSHIIAALAGIGAFGIMASCAKLVNDPTPTCAEPPQPLPNRQWFTQQHATFVLKIEQLTRLEDTGNGAGPWVYERCRNIAKEYNKYAVRVAPATLTGLPNRLYEGAC